MKKKGDILIENVIFIILNIIFVSILLLFLFKQGGGAVLWEQTYSKQIALIIDSAKPNMKIELNMDKAKKISDENGLDFGNVVKINGNVVRVKLSQKGGYEYSFFNDVNVTAFPDDENEEVYIFTILKNENK